MRKIKEEDIEKRKEEITNFFSGVKFPFMFMAVAEIEGGKGVWANTYTDCSGEEVLAMFVKLFSDENAILEIARKAIKMVDFGNQEDSRIGIAELLGSVLYEIPPTDETIKEVISSIKDDIKKISDEERKGDINDVDNLINNCFTDIDE